LPTATTTGTLDPAPAPWSRRRSASTAPAPDRLGDIGPWFEGSSAADLHRLSATISGATLAAFAAADDAELDAARGELRALFRTILEIAPILERLLGRGALGLDTVAGVFAALTDGYQPFLLLMWMALREDPGLREEMGAITAALPEAIAGRASFEVLIGLREEIPAFAVLTDELLRAALVDVSGKEALGRELRRLFGEHEAEVESFTRENRELALRAGLAAPEE
jgi:hypothetical protein